MGRIDDTSGTGGTIPQGHGDQNLTPANPPTQSTGSTHRYTTVQADTWANGPEASVWRPISEIAKLAPTPHNTQGFRISPVSATEAKILFIPQRALPEEDHGNRYMLMTTGTFARAVEIAGLARGLRLEIAPMSIEPDQISTSSKPVHVATINILGEQEPQTELLNLLKRRKTSRLPYNNKPVGKDDLKKLSELAQRAGHRFIAHDDPAVVEDLLKQNAQSVVDNLQIAKETRELRGWMRFGKTPQHGDGMWEEPLQQAKWLSLPAFKFPRMVKIPGIRHLSEAIYLRSMRGTCDVGLLCGPFEDESPLHLYKTGKFFMDFWLEMEHQGIVMQPMGSMLTNANHAALVAEKFKVADSWLAFRMGYSEDPPRAPRLKTILYEEAEGSTAAQPLALRPSATQETKPTISIVGRIKAKIAAGLRNIFDGGFLRYLVRVATLNGNRASRFMNRSLAANAFQRALQRVPAYVQFLKDQGAETIRSWDQIPIMTKKNYVLAYGPPSTLVDGRIPAGQVDQSSGSTGNPSIWYRDVGELTETARMMQYSARLLLDGQPASVFNTFALGPWATGITVHGNLNQVLTSYAIGPDIDKTLYSMEEDARMAAEKNEPRVQVVVGYPPFITALAPRIQDAISSGKIDKSHIELWAIGGGEATTPSRRRALLEGPFDRVQSSYGASDLTINVGAQDEWAIALEEIAFANPELCKLLFGRETPPSVFHYDPAYYYIEESPIEGPEGTIDRLLFTQLGHVTYPKIRYDLGDEGGVRTYKEVATLLQKYGIEMPKRRHKMPILFIWGRAENAVAYSGSKITPDHLQEALAAVQVNGHPLTELVSNFALHIFEDDSGADGLNFLIELKPGMDSSFDQQAVRDALINHIRQNNQDFNEAVRFSGDERIRLYVYMNGEGPNFHPNPLTKKQYIFKGKAAVKKPVEPNPVSNATSSLAAGDFENYFPEGQQTKVQANLPALTQEATDNSPLTNEFPTGPKSLAQGFNHDGQTDPSSGSAALQLNPMLISSSPEPQIKKIDTTILLSPEYRMLLLEAKEILLTQDLTYAARYIQRALDNPVGDIIHELVSDEASTAYLIAKKATQLGRDPQEIEYFNRMASEKRFKPASTTQFNPMMGVRSRALGTFIVR